MRQLDPNSGEPPYIQIIAALRQSVEDGEYGPGQRIPSRPRLEGHFGVAGATVIRAVSQLEAEGILVGRQGSGVFVTSNAPAMLASDKRPTRKEFNELCTRVKRLEDQLARLLP